MRRIVSIIAGGLLLATLGAAPVVAAVPMPVSIVAVHQNVDGTDVATFTAEGAGLCPSGSVYLLGGMVTGGPSPEKNFLVLQAFVCDPVGAFTTEDFFIVRIQAHTMAGAPNDWGTWQVIDGGGEFAQLQGTGTLVGIYDGQGGITDYLNGQLK
jgi:hypothetical protein